MTENIKNRIDSFDGFRAVGTLTSVQGILAASLPATVGELCELRSSGRDPQLAEVVGFSQGTAKILPFDAPEGLSQSDKVVGLKRRHQVPFGAELLGRVIDALGNPIDGAGPIRCRQRLPVRPTTPSPLTRNRIEVPFVTGQRVIDGLLTCGVGQRVGLFAGSGVGKSTLLGEVARGSSSDLNVIALIGERGREVRPFLEDCVGVEGLRKSVTVVATSEQSPLMRVRAAQTAVTIADGFRRQGGSTLLLLDSMTRIAMAQREIGLLLGEPPTARGYTPSVFQMLSRLLEQLGNSDKGSITGIVTVLVDGDDMDEPIADAVRSIVDGHIVLSRKLAQQGHYPAIDVAQSVSRVMTYVASDEHLRATIRLRALRSTYDQAADLIRIGAYKNGTSAEIDDAIRLLPALNSFVRQRAGEYTDFETTKATLVQIADMWRHLER